MAPSYCANEITIDVGWGKCAAKAWGPEDGRPVLALHGWLDNASSFDRLVPLLASNWRVVALDLPGHGLSDHRPAGTTYHFIDGMIDVTAVASSLGWKQYTLLGHSLGGGIASLLAGTVPDCIEALVLIEALGPLSWEAAEGPQRLGAFIAERANLSQKRLPVYPSIEAAAEARRKVGDLSADSARILATRGTRCLEGGVTWRSDRRLRLPSAYRFTEDQILFYLKAIRCPSLVIRALQGLPFEQAIWARRAACIPHLNVNRLPGGHHLHLDAPDVVAPVIRGFLNQ